MRIDSITNLLIDLKIRTPEAYWKEELIRFITEARSERIVEVPIIINNIPKKKSKILDIGCRYSLLPLQLASLGHKVYGIDVHDYKREHKNFYFIKGDIITYPFENNLFDVAISLSTIEHIGLNFYGDAKNRSGDEEAADRVYSLLKNKGLFLLTVPYGIPKDNKWYRIYNYQRLEHLLKKFKIVEKQAFIEIKKSWIPAPLNVAEKIESVGSVHSVIFVKAGRSI